MKKQLRWFLFNGIIGAAVYFGIIEHHEGAQNVALFAVWTTSILALFVFNEEVKKALQKNGRTVNVYIDLTYDLFILGALIWNGWWLTGTAWLIHMGLQNSAYSVSLEKEEVTDSDGTDFT